MDEQRRFVMIKSWTPNVPDSPLWQWGKEYVGTGITFLVIDPLAGMEPEFAALYVYDSNQRKRRIAMWRDVEELVPYGAASLKD